MRIWPPNITLEKFSATGSQTATEYVGIILTELGEDYLTGELTVDARTRQPNGTLHGGASAILAESLASLAANGLVDRSRFVCMGQQINLNHLRPVPVGMTISGTTRAFSIDDTSHVWGVEIVDPAGMRVCVGRVMMAVVPRPPNITKFL